MTLPLVAMDNFRVDVTAYKSDILKHTLELALAHHSLVESYSEIVIADTKTLLLYWYFTKEDANQVKFPYKQRIEQLLPFVNGWLENQDYGREPDIDGSCSKGWRVFNNLPSQATNMRIGFQISFCVQPVWAEHHK